jgi:hypothetical protein
MPDGSLGTYSSGMTFSYADQTLPGNQHSKASQSLPGPLTSTNTPTGFPLDMWNDQAHRYSQWWKWWRGDPFNETLEDAVGDKPPVYRYPLRINTLRQICRIHNAMLWGKARRHDGMIVQTRVLPPISFSGGKGARNETLRPFADSAERMIRYIWQNSNQSSLLWEGGLVSQFLGGYYLQLQNLTGISRRQIPLGVRMLYPDFVLPIQNPDDPYELLEAYVTYRITGVVARAKYGIEVPKSNAYAVYTQHWTQDTYSEFVDGRPITKTMPGVMGSKIQTIQHERPNPFGFVPIVYVPRMRSGAFMGDPITPEIVGLLAEYNARYGDVGDIVDQTAQVMWQLSNSTTGPEIKHMSDDTPYVDLGSRQPGPYSESPTMEPKRPEQANEATLKYPQQLRTDIMRESMTSPVTLGDDPGGGQRSGETLLIRMFPTLAMADASRAFADPALRLIEMYMLLAISRLGLRIDGVGQMKEDDVYSLDITHSWNPSIPRDDEKDTNRRVTEYGAGTMSLQRAVEQQPDVDDVEEEIALIRADAAERQKMAMETATAVGDKKSGSKEKSEDSETAESPSEGEDQD